MKFGKIYSKYLMLEFYKVLSQNAAMAHCWKASKSTRQLMITNF